MSEPADLLPNNATNEERALSQATGRVGGVPVVVREIWNPDTCPTDLLPWLAWALSIDTWRSSWPEQVKRERIRQAVSIQRRKGSVKSVRDVVSSFGANLALIEWWQKSPEGVPHTFDVTLTVDPNSPDSAEFQDDIINEIERTKPVRSQFTFTAGLNAQGSIGFQGIARPVQYRRLSFVEA